MATKRRLVGGVAGLGVALTALTGCQTWFGGMTLPSGQYLKHYPQYFPPDPDFPLQKELNSMQDPDGALRRGAAAPAAAPLPPPAAIVPPAPAGGPGPAPDGR